MSTSHSTESLPNTAPKGNPMKKLLTATAALALLAGCTAAQLTTATNDVNAIEVAAVNDANTFCKIANTVVPYIATGASIASVIYPPAGATLVAISDTAAPALASACKAAGGITVSPVKPVPAVTTSGLCTVATDRRHCAPAV
jgi:hypothetical protein